MSYAYVGCRTTKERNARGQGIVTYRIDDVTGDWEKLQVLKTEEENPSYQCFDTTKNFLYSVHGDKTSISAYRILEDGTLEALNTVDIGGRNPVYIEVDNTNQFIVVATLQGGAVYSVRRNADGSIGETVCKADVPGKKEGSISFPHMCNWDRTGNYLFVPAQGRIQGYAETNVFRFDHETGQLALTDCVRTRDGYEPRHMAIHPNNRYAYILNELGNTISFMLFDKNEGKLTQRQIIDMLPETYTGNAEGGGIAISPDGKCVVASSRTFNQVMTFLVDQNTGFLKKAASYSSIGKMPRFMGFNHDYSRVYLANETTDNIVEMKLDSNTGIMEYTGRIIETGSPVCIMFRA